MVCFGRGWENALDDPKRCNVSPVDRGRREPVRFRGGNPGRADDWGGLAAMDADGVLLRAGTAVLLVVGGARVFLAA
ncbi:hypothetical protein M2163_000458 [Streptomyces sp. SAI-135]|nr:hypothetical protein [Streptomyces sp. SAI-090]MDH6554650.1 hypothetical protein [Streptomyces sp. SAI-041]MDH6573920.1 hypothetical protein [Streptomyces sp. SAI-117]MDH6581343.1 hypothetical protein [Streptomyces sp. SAI-133]MDH6613350.1 hypothetical protein [Streptomyces sp. SAI-135]